MYEQQLYDFTNSKYAEVYKAFFDFGKFYPGRNEDETAISIDNFVKNYPIFVFNCMFVEPLLKAEAIDHRLECEFHENVTRENLTAYCLVFAKNR